MDLRQLRYFCAIYKARNLSHAANSCNVAQSALSHHIAQLEDDLGTQLFTRRPRGMDPTAAGVRLFKHANTIFSQLESAREDVKRGAQELSGEISVGMPNSVIKVIGIDLLKRVQQDYPNVSILLTESLSGDGFEQLIKGSNRIALLYNPPADERTKRIPILEEELYFVGHRSIMGDSQGPLTFSDLTAYPLMLLHRGMLARALLDKPQILNALQSKSKISLASVAATISALEAGLACTLVPKVLVKEQLACGELIARPVIDPVPIRTLFLTEKADQTPTFLTETITQLMIELVRNAINDGRWSSATILLTN